jgi:hypothetical protein
LIRWAVSMNTSRPVGVSSLISLVHGVRITPRSAAAPVLAEWRA